MPAYLITTNAFVSIFSSNVVFCQTYDNNIGATKHLTLGFSVVHIKYNCHLSKN